MQPLLRLISPNPAAMYHLDAGYLARIHLRQSSVFDHGIFGQGKMMGCGFRMNIGTSLFRLPHQFYRFLTADMLDIDAGTGLLCKLQIPFH